MDIESILADDHCKQCREDHYEYSATLAAGARAWCTSGRWKMHTPALEDWKISVEDLGREALTEASVEEMASAGRGLPFPPIPFFEDEQARDLCQILTGPEAAAALVDRLHDASPTLLAIDPAAAAVRCWENLVPHAKAGLGFVAWQWMLADHVVPRRDSLPSPEDATALANRESLRSAAAVRNLEQAARERLESRADVEPALAVADALSLWNRPEFLEWAVRHYARHGGPPSFRQRLESAVASRAKPPAEDAPLTACLKGLGLAASSGDAVEQFAGPIDAQPWARLEAEARNRTPRVSGPHPLTTLTQYIQSHDFPVAWEDGVWDRLQSFLRLYPGLLDLDGAHPENPLPALQLAASIRSSKTIGEVALGLVALADGCRGRSDWWKAVRAGLRPMARRAGLGNAGDSLDTAVRVLKLWGGEAGVTAGDAHGQK